MADVPKDIMEHLPLRRVDTEDFAEIFDRHGEKVALTVRPDLIMALNSYVPTPPANKEYRALLDTLRERVKLKYISPTKDGLEQLVPLETVTAAADLIEALLSERERRTPDVVTVPDGWKLVPIEPTEAMITAGRIARMNIEGGYGGPGPWEAMLSAAPSLSTSAGGEE